LPGIAISVSLVPPLALIGVSYSVARPDLLYFYLWVFIFNLIGMVFGSLLVYVLLRFDKAREKVEEDIES
jgi:uncharacterized membrane protein